MKHLQTLIFTLALSLSAQLGYAASGGGTTEGPQYVPIEPPLVVNITDGQSLRFMQVSAQFKVADADTATAINTHISAIRHALLMLLGDQAVRDVYTTRGKEKLRQQCLKEVKTVLNDYTDTKLIENIYFTSFIIQ